MKQLFTGIVCSVILTCTSAFAQNVAINTTGAVANSSAMLDVDATNKGLLIPRVALGATNSNAPIGAGVATSLMVYNTATAGVFPNNVTPGYYYWDGAQWVRFQTTINWTTLGNAGTNPAVNFAGTTDAQDFAFRTNNTEKMRITSAGNAGIGTTAPLERLHIVGGNVRISNLAGVGNRMVFADANGTLGVVAAGTVGQVMTQTAGGPAWQSFTGWLVGGNTLGATGIFGTLSNNHVDFYTNNTFRARYLNNGDFSINSTTYIAPAIPGDKLGVFITANTNSWAMDGVNTSASGGSIYADNTNGANPYNAMEGIQNGSQSGVLGLHITNTAGNGVAGQTNRLNNQWGLYSDDNAFALGYFVPSDEKLKTNVKPINNALADIEKLNPVSYNWNMDKYPTFGFDTRVTNYGLLAQDLHNVYPDMVAVNSFSAPASNPVQGRQSNENAKYEFSSVNYTALVPVLIQGIKELNAGMTELKKENQELKDRLQKLEAQMLQIQK